MSTTNSSLSYSGTTLTLANSDFRGKVYAYLWGGAGGGGGGDGGLPGGNGSGGGYSLTTFNISPGDVVDIAVGGAGGAGVGQRGSASGGTAGGSYTGYSGGAGGNAGPGGSSGGGGGGGGATVLRLNSSVIGVAAGGAGGAGSGYRSGNQYQNAPGPNGYSPNSSAGQNGGNHPGDGGGGGGGSGGYLGGQGGYWGGASAANPQGLNDVTGQAGSNGTNFGTVIAAPVGRTPGGTSNPFYPGSVAIGGAGSVGTGTPGTNGYALLAFDIPGTYINNNGTYVPVDTTWINVSGTWVRVQTTYIKMNGTWKALLGVVAPTYNTIPGAFGVNSRPGPSYYSPVPEGD